MKEMILMLRRKFSDKAVAEKAADLAQDYECELIWETETTIVVKFSETSEAISLLNCWENEI